MRVPTFEPWVHACIMCVYLLFVAAVIGLFQRSLEEIKADLVDGRFEKVVLHQTVNHVAKTHISISTQIKSLQLLYMTEFPML